MAVRNVFKLGESDDVLRKKSRPVMEIDGKTLLLIDDLKGYFTSCRRIRTCRAAGRDTEADMYSGI